MTMGIFRKPPTELTAEQAEGSNHLLSDAAQSIGQLAVEISDIAGNVDEVAQRVEHEAQLFQRLGELAQSLRQSNRSVDLAAADANSLTTRASERMQDSRGTIDAALTDIRRLAEAVQQVHGQLGGLNEALAAISKVSSRIGSIAKQTRTLALNATIEASRAGSAGRGFAVVADQVKELANQTAQATDEIGHGMQRLRSQVGELVSHGSQATSLAGAVNAGTLRIGEAIAEVAEALGEADAQSAVITEAVGQIDGYTGQTLEGLEELSADVELSADNLKDSRERVGRLLGHTESLMNLVNQSPQVDTEERDFIRLAREGADRISAAFEHALQEGVITHEELFDRDYQPIAGTEPRQYGTRYANLSDRLLPPIQEAIKDSDPRLIAAIACDDGGYIATHNRAFSQPQRPDDPVWNKAHSRHRTIFNDRVGLAAGRNTRAFLIQAYRRDMGGGQFALMKDISAPISVGGRHWGAIRLLVRP